MYLHCFRSRGVMTTSRLSDAEYDDLCFVSTSMKRRAFDTTIATDDLEFRRYPI